MKRFFLIIGLLSLALSFSPINTFAAKDCSTGKVSCFIDDTQGDSCYTDCNNKPGSIDYYCGITDSEHNTGVCTGNLTPAPTEIPATTFVVCSDPTSVPCKPFGSLCNSNTGNNCCSGVCNATNTVEDRCTAPDPKKPTPTPQTTKDCHTYSQDSCARGSICYDGDLNTDHIVPGAQCGKLQGWHFGNDGNGNVPKCGLIGNPYCCDAGPATVNFTYQQPCVKDKNGNCTSVNTAFGDIPINVTSAISAIFAVLLSFSGGIVLLIIIFAGYRIMTSGGDQEKLKGAREMLTAGIIGLLFIIFSVTILRIIGVDILHIPGFAFK